MRKKFITQAKVESERFEELVETFGVNFIKSPKRVIKSTEYIASFVQN